MNNNGAVRFGASCKSFVVKVTLKMVFTEGFGSINLFNLSGRLDLRDVGDRRSRRDQIGRWWSGRKFFVKFGRVNLVNERRRVRRVVGKGLKVKVW